MCVALRPLRSVVGDEFLLDSYAGLRHWADEIKNSKRKQATFVKHRRNGKLIVHTENPKQKRLRDKHPSFVLFNLGVRCGKGKFVNAWKT